MMLGKRGRAKQPMRRTTSMTEFTLPDVMSDVIEEEEEQQEQQHDEHVTVRPEKVYGGMYGGAAAGQDWLAAYRARTAPARFGHRRNSADYSVVETAAFLRSCGLCKRRLGPGRDTFMYKGETAFCSLECRQQHITHEEWKEKCTLTSMKEVTPVSSASEKSGTGETVAAA